MGITGFYQYLQDVIPGAFYNVNNITTEGVFFDHIYIDLNYLLHQCSYNSDTVDFTLKKVETMIMDICIKFNPLETLNLCADGSAPLAKILLQRERRSNDSIEENFVLNFTPGSEFMNSLHLKLDGIKKRIEDRYSIKVTIHNQDVGEAEIKIKNLILKNIAKNSQSLHLAVTNDADVVLIMSATKQYENIYILTKNKEQKLVSINSIVRLSGFEALDFGFLNIFLGNDYLPKLKIVTQEKLWVAYKIYKNQYGNLVELCTENYEEYTKINDDFLKRILSGIVGQTKISVINKSTLKSYDSDIIKSYLEGINWCFNMYLNGRSINNHYMYEAGLPIDPIHIIMFLNNTTMDSTKNLIKTEPISNELCSILLLPLSAKKLIDSKYYDFMDSDICEILYEREHCKLCKKFKVNLETTKQVNLETNKEKYLEHKKSHKNLLVSDIKDIQKSFSNLFNS
jgi:5'-3' exonuclease